MSNKLVEKKKSELLKLRNSGSRPCPEGSRTILQRFDLLTC
jgi:hypothetical protein